MKINGETHYLWRGLCQSEPRPSVTGAPQTAPMRNPFRYFNSSPEVIRLVVMMYVKYPLSLRNVEGPAR